MTILQGWMTLTVTSERDQSLIGAAEESRKQLVEHIGLALAGTADNTSTPIPASNQWGGVYGRLRAEGLE